MRKNFGAQPWIYPQPVLIIASYGEDGTPDAMNAAWGGVADRSRIAMYLSGGHKTVKNILKRGAFTVSMGDVEHLVACDYVGIVSGNSVPDKVERAGFHVTKSEHVDAPMIPNLVETRICDAATMRTSPVGGLLNAACLTPKIFNVGENRDGFVGRLGAGKLPRYGVAVFDISRLALFLRKGRIPAPLLDRLIRHTVFPLSFRWRRRQDLNLHLLRERCSAD